MRTRQLSRMFFISLPVCLLGPLAAEEGKVKDDVTVVVAPCDDKSFPSDDDKALVARVAAKILGEVRDQELAPIADYDWPPEVCIHPTKVVNAFASLRIEKMANGHEVKKPHIQINQGYLDKIVKGNEEFFAKVFGHELSHVLLRHVDPAQPPAGPLAWNVVSREHETNADVLGMKLALRANYPYRQLVASMARERDDGNFCAYQALSYTHPAWADRLAAIDDRQSELWRATSAFENGVNFLCVEQYGLAARCFQQVVKDFPRCHEGWTNLGYAKLMLYCDQFEPEDVRRLDLGHLAVGGFYRRAESIEPSRGGPEDDWKEARAALQQSLRIKPNSIVAQATYATTLLVQPNDRDLGKVNELFSKAIEAIDALDKSEPLERDQIAAILVNAGVAKAAAGDAKGAAAVFDRVVEMAGKGSANGAIQAVYYHQAQALSALDDNDSRMAAIQAWTKYLTTTASSGVWWEIAYQEYQKLCAAVQKEPQTREEFDIARKLKSRPVLSVTFGDGKAVFVGLPIAEAVSVIGEGEKSDLVRGTSIHQRKYRELGTDLVGSDLLLAVRLRGKRAPEIKLSPLGGGSSTRTLRVGMSMDEFEKTIAGSGAEYDTRFGTGSSIPYRFYPQLGLGISLDDKKVVDEIIVGQLPYPTRP